MTALRVSARHPDRVHSAFLTGVPLKPAGVGLRPVRGLRLVFWRAPWFWLSQAAAMGIPKGSRALYVTHTLSVRRGTAAAMNAEVCAGGVPGDLRRYSGPLLAIAGERDPQWCATP